MSIVKEAIEKYDGRVIPFTCPSDITVGDVVPLGTEMVGIAVNSGLTGETISLEIEKVWTVTAATADAIAIGDVIYWNATAKVMTIQADDGGTPAVNYVVAGRAMSSKAAGTPGTVDVKINVL